MTKFQRMFDVDALKAIFDKLPIVRRLFAEWQVPGPDAEPTALGLRLAVRNGYLNFYAKGQSVAKLSIVRGNPKLHVHEAYVIRNKSKFYRSYTGSALAELEDRQLAEWTTEALKYAGQEKKFVDDLVSANAGTIDLEMALPGDARVTNKGKKVAPRMDIVVVQQGSTGPELAFWEAKCADNSELRAFGEPHIMRQLQQYIAWLRLSAISDGPDTMPSRGDQVLEAYRKAACVLIELVGVARKPETEAVRIWKRARQELSAVAQPGVVIGNYCSDGHADPVTRAALLARNAKSFEEKCHLAKLQEAAIEVVQYAARPTSPLPTLAGATLTSKAVVS